LPLLIGPPKIHTVRSELREILELKVMTFDSCRGNDRDVSGPVRIGTRRRVSWQRALRISRIVPTGVFLVSL
jgi:hypothetical protein